MNKKYKLAVYIGRFQPMHLGHEALISKAKEIADEVLVLVGSSKNTITVKNPFSFEERKTMINSVFPDVFIVPVEDSAYNFHDWLSRVKSEIESHLEEPFNVGDITIIGHYKDDTSYYLNYFPEYFLTVVENNIGNINATEIREKFFNTDTVSNTSDTVSDIIYDIMSGSSEDFTRLSDLKNEFNFIKNYKEQWSKAPYPPTFVTTDTICLCLGHVLLIKRGRHPGKGLWALPGGFLDQGETIESCAIRELHEETKINIPKIVLKNAIKESKVFDHPYRDPRGRTISHAFLVDLSNQTVLPQIEADDDAALAIWVPIHKLKEIADKFFNDHYQIVQYFVNRLR